jgi:hypothetical protein
MPPVADPAADVAIVGTARALELRFHAQPDLAETRIESSAS